MTCDYCFQVIGSLFDSFFMHATRRSQPMKKHFFLLLPLALLSLLLPGQIKADTPAIPHVIDTQVSEGAESLSLAVYFTMMDGSGKPYAEVPLQTATLQFENGSSYPATLDKPAFYMALLLDASGSMRDVLGEMKEAAIAAINAAPEEVQFAVIRFDEQIDLLQAFTNDHSQAIAAVNSMEIDNSGTCLYDVATTTTQALQQLSQDTPYRSMILFSDGRDETSQTAGGACSQNTFEQLVAVATEGELPVPIHTVGIAGSQNRIDAAALTSLSQDTGGLSAVGDQDVRDQTFKQIMDGVRAQWVARARLMPSLGYHRGMLLLTQEDQRRLAPAGISLTSMRDYVVAPPPAAAPVSVEISNFTYDRDADTLVFDVALTSSEKVGTLQIEIIDKIDNVQAARQIQNRPAISQRIIMDASPLTADRRYLVKVHPIDFNGSTIKDGAGSALEASHEFRYDPIKTLTMQIDSVAINDQKATIDFPSLRIQDDEPTILFSIHVTNPDLAAHYEGRFLNQENQQVGEPFHLIFSTQAGHDNFKAQTPLSLEGGHYRVFVHAMSANGDDLASADYRFRYQPPSAPLVQTIRAWQDNPLLTIISLLLLIATLFFGWRLGRWYGMRKAKNTYKEWLPADALLVPKGKPAAMPRVRLRVLESPDKSIVNGSGQLLTRLPFTIGRDESDLSITNDRHVSRRHATISYEQGIFYIEDNGSSNGTFVNEARIAVRQPTPLSVDIGAKIRIGKTTNLSFSEETE